MNPVWHPLWLAVETAVWLLALVLLVLGTYVVAMGLTRRRPWSRRRQRVNP
ncbi:MAG TPA: hypothetical protein VJ206_08305 [bacterium]|nr:hypothetical protein [bacterium]